MTSITGTETRMDNGWVIFGYLVAYAGIGVYTARLALRIRSRRRALRPPP